MNDFTPPLQEIDPAQRLVAMMNGYQQTCVIFAASELGIFEHVALGPLAEETLAERVSADPRALHRLLRALRSLSLVDGEREVELTAMGRLLVPCEPGLADMSILIGGEYLQSWGALHYSVRTGLPSFEKIFGMTAWEHRKLRPELGEAFNRMTSGHTNDEVRTLAKAYDFSLHRHIVDVGGGSGYFLKAILEQHPTLRATLFDLPQVVLEPVVVGEQCTVIGGSFTESVPVGGDLYILKHILHDWRDEACIAILGNVREAIAPGGTLLVIESILPERDFEPAAARRLAMLDLHMMAMLGGRERELSEYERLLCAGGFELVLSVAGAPHILIARPL
jgi:hypothetical protein